MQASIYFTWVNFPRDGASFSSNRIDTPHFSAFLGAPNLHSSRFIEVNTTNLSVYYTFNICIQQREFQL